MPEEYGNEIKIDYQAPKTLGHQIAEHISEQIIHNVYPKDYKLKVLNLANEYSVSQTTIREALQILEKYNLVRTIPRKGTFIKGITKEEILDIWAIKERLWSLAVRLFIERNDDAKIKELICINESVVKAAKSGNTEEVFKYNFAWANFVLENCKSEDLYYLLNNIEKRVKRWRFQSIHMDNNLKETTRYVVNVGKAMQKRNIVEAEENIRNFIIMDKNVLLKNFDKLK